MPVYVRDLGTVYSSIEPFSSHARDIFRLIEYGVEDAKRKISHYVLCAFARSN